MKITIQIIYEPETDEEKKVPRERDIYANVTEFALVGQRLDQGVIRQPFRSSNSSGGAWGILSLLEKLGGLMEILRAMLPAQLESVQPAKPAEVAKPAGPSDNGD